MSGTRKTETSQHPVLRGKPRFEHWFRDNQVYFLTARVRNQFPAFDTPEASNIFWNKFDQYTSEFGFTPWVTSLVVNHYHTIGYLKVGEDVPKMMQKLHGSVSKLVNDLIEERASNDNRYRPRVLKATKTPVGSSPQASVKARIVPFWIDAGHQNYFDGCIRNERQAMKTFRYVYEQCRRHRIHRDPETYPDTTVNVSMERAITRATELKAFLYDVPYKRYVDKGKVD